MELGVQSEQALERRPLLVASWRGIHDVVDHGVVEFEQLADDAQGASRLSVSQRSIARRSSRAASPAEASQLLSTAAAPSWAWARANTPSKRRSRASAACHARSGTSPSRA